MDEKQNLTMLSLNKEATKMEKIYRANKAVGWSHSLIENEVASCFM